MQPIEGKMEAVSRMAAAYLSLNHTAVADIPTVVQAFSAAVDSMIAPPAAPMEEPKKLEPAISIKKSVTPDAIVCLEDGLKFKSLKRHLRTKYNLSPEEYRAKWGLAADYPMVAPNYAKTRSDLAKALGLGQLRNRAPAEAIEAPAKAPKAKRAPKAKAAPAPEAEPATEATEA